MEYVRVDGVTSIDALQDKPRRLTQEELDDVVSNIPAIPGADPYAARVARDGLVAWIRSALEETVICPSAVKELIKITVRDFNRSLITPGSPVGITAAEALGATMTQMTLNTFHSSGRLESATSSIEVMRDLIFARKNPKNETCTVFFKDKHLTYEQVLAKRADIVGSVPYDFIDPILKYEIGDPRVPGDGVDPNRFWHKIYETLFGRPLPRSSKVLRLYLNTTAMVKQRVTMAMLADTINRSKDQSIVAVYGPIADGIMDLYPDPTRIVDCNKRNIPSVMKEQSYLEECTIPELKEVRIKGLPGITDLFPVVSPVWRVVVEERRLNAEEKRIFGPQIVGDLNRIWRLILNPIQMKLTGVVSSNVKRLCELAGMTVIIPQEVAVSLLVLMPDAAVKTIEVENKTTGVKTKEIKDMTPGEWVINQVNEAKELRSTEIKNRQKIRSALLAQLPEGSALPATVPSPEDPNVLIPVVTLEVPRAPIVQAAEFVIAVTEGSNFLELLAHHGVDKTLTSCSNMHTWASTLGIEAARTFFVRRLTETISGTGAYVSPANIEFLGEFFMSRGVPLGATFISISRQNAGHISLATLERAGSVFSTAAIKGSEEDTRGVSTSIVVGKRIALGTGAFDVAQTIQTAQGEKILLNEETFRGFENDIRNVKADVDREDLNSALRALGPGAIQVLDETRDEEEDNPFSVFLGQEAVLDVRAGELAPRFGGLLPIGSTSFGSETIALPTIRPINAVEEIPVPQPSGTMPITALASYSIPILDDDTPVQIQTAPNLQIGANYNALLHEAPAITVLSTPISTTALIDQPVAPVPVLGAGIPIELLALLNQTSTVQIIPELTGPNNTAGLMAEAGQALTRNLIPIEKQ